MRQIESTLILIALGTAALVSAVVAAPVGYESDTRAYNLAYGRTVFTEQCLRCHRCGRRGAPMLSEADDWKDRIDQPLDTLISHAIEGHGDMPARGDLEISDQDIAAAVAYVLNRVRLLTADALNELPPPGAGAPDINTGESVEPVMNLLLMLLGRSRDID